MNALCAVVRRQRLTASGWYRRGLCGGADYGEWHRFELLASGAQRGPEHERGRRALTLRLGGARLELESAWSDECAVRASTGSEVSITVEKASGTGAHDQGPNPTAGVAAVVDVASQSMLGAPGPAGLVQCRVPEAIDLIVLDAENVSLTGKIEGDVRVEAAGVVRAAKLRGHQISLQAASVTVSSVLEGETVAVRTDGDVSVKRAMATTLSISGTDDSISDSSGGCHHLELGALYAADAVLDARADVMLGAVHGSVHARSSDAAVSITSLVGSARVDAAADVSLHIDRLESASSVRSSHGTVAVTLVPAVAAQIDARASGAVQAGDQLVRENDATADATIDTASTIADQPGSMRLQGMWHPSADAAALAIDAETERSTGKVSQDGASAYAVSTSFFGSADGDAQESSDAMPPMLQLEAASGDVSLDALGWRDMMMRRMESMGIDVSKSKHSE